MKLDTLNLKELLTLKNCLDFLMARYHNNYMIRNCESQIEEDVKRNKISKILKNVISEIEKKVLEYD